MLSFSWLLLASIALVIATSSLLLYQALSRRLRRLQQNIHGDITREWKSKFADLAKHSRQTESQLKELQDTALSLAKLAASYQGAQPQPVVTLPQIQPESPVLQQMSYLLGQNEIHAVVSYPKTGGTTLVATLADLFPEKFVPVIPFQTHLLSPPSQTLTSFFEGIIAYTSGTPWSAHDDLFPMGWDKKLEVGHAHRVLLKERRCIPLDKARLNTVNVRRGRPERVINYILTARDPVAACVSFLFQFVSTWKRWENLSDDALLAYLQSPKSPPLIPSSPGCPWPLTQDVWWQEQIEQVFGLDLLSLDFDSERGWQIYDFGEVRFLVIRLENFDALPKALSTFYDLPEQRIHVLNSNIGEAKGEHGKRYRSFRSRVKIPMDLLDMAYSSRVAKHFYSADELEIFRSRWSSTH